MEKDWISVKERLPKANEKVLAYYVDMPTYLDGELVPEVKHTDYWISQYCPDDEGSIRAWKYVTHWQPLEPPVQPQT